MIEVNTNNVAYVHDLSLKEFSALMPFYEKYKINEEGNEAYLSGSGEIAGTHISFFTKRYKKETILEWQK
jgi:hypothetical protein